MVLPFVPVTPTVWRRRRGVAVERAAAGAIAARTLGTVDLRDPRSERALDDQRDRAARDRRPARSRGRRG